MAERLFQIGIKGIITNEKGQILLLYVGKWGGNEGHWDVPGGRMDDGETFEQTLARELKEEINCSYTGTPEHFMTVVSNITIPVGNSRVGLVLMAYHVSLDENAKIELMDHETSFEWVDPSEAAQRLTNKYPPEFTDKIASL